VVLGATVGDADLAETNLWIGALSTGPVDALRGAKLRRARSSNKAFGAVIVASADIRRRTVGLSVSCGAGDASLDAYGETLAPCRRAMADFLSEDRGLNCESVRSFQTASAWPFRSFVKKAPLVSTS